MEVRKIDLEQFEQNIGYTFQDKSLLQTALTHSSYAFDTSTQSYERLEFLGDSILEFVSSEYLYENYKKLTEGQMTKVRSSAVCEDSLYDLSLKLGFPDYVRLGKSELQQGLHKAIYADTVEAVIAAIYLDSDLEHAKKFILDNLTEKIQFTTKHVGEKDYKTVLQEKLQVHGSVDIKYEIIGTSGPDHDKVFTAQVKCNGEFLAKGSGSSKKLAEMDAAKHALENN